LLALSTLWEVLRTRPVAREACLPALLAFTQHADDDLREQSTAFVRRLSALTGLQPAIHEFSRRNLKALVAFSSSSSSSAADPVSVEATLQRAVNLHYALCTVAPELLSDVAAVFAEASRETKLLLLQSIDKPALALGQTSPGVLALVREYTPGTSSLVLRLLDVLVSKEPVASVLVDVIRDVYPATATDARLLVPALLGLTKGEIVTHLPALLKLPAAHHAHVFKRLLTPAPALVAAAAGADVGVSGHALASPLGAAELLVVLHTVPGVTVAEAKAAVGHCLACPRAFPQEVLSVALQQLVYLV
jgi:symplekin